MGHIELITTLAVGLGAALLLGYISFRLGLSPIVGYLVAGIIVGPHTPGVVADRELAEQMAELGVVLLMFGVGLHFHFKDLLAVRKIAIPGAVVQSAVATGLGLAMAISLGWSWQAGLVYGLAISVASTVVLTRVLSDNDELHTRVGHIAIGWLVVEDLFTVVILVLLPEIFGGNSGDLSHLAGALGLAGLKILVLVAAMVLIGGRAIPWLLGHISELGSRELFTLTVLVVALGIAVGSARLFGVSMALGAFLAGMVVGRSDFSLRAASEALPMRDAFAVLFFVSTGMLFNPSAVPDGWQLIVLTMAIVVLGKPLAAFVIVRQMRYPVRVALAVAVALSQVGEFTFILGAVALKLELISRSAMNALVATAILSISINPLIYRLIDPFEGWAKRRGRLWSWLSARVPTAKVTEADNSPSETRYRAIVVGYGPVGQTVTRLLCENDVEPTIIELSIRSFRKLRTQHTAAVFGDAQHPETLEAAGLATAGSLILTASDLASATETIRNARRLRPEIHILVRANYLRDADRLRQAGANDVFTGEGEVALAMTKFVMRDLGATPEQIDRERERLRGEFITQHGGTKLSHDTQYIGPSVLKKEER